MSKTTENLIRGFEIAAVVVAVFGAIGGLLLLQESWIDKTVERKLGDETILRRIAASSRPTLFFAANEVITADMGAAALVKDIHIVFRDHDGWPDYILVDFNRYLNDPPILTVYGETAATHSERAKMFAWKLYVDDMVPHNSDSNKWQFRLDIVP